MEILKKGYKIKPEDIKYFMRCRTCGCEFIYQEKDTHLNYLSDFEFVYCPDCKYSCVIIFKKKYKEKKHGRKRI